MGLKAKTSIDRGYYYAPYIPEIKTMTWQKYLLELELRHKDYNSVRLVKMTGLEVVNELMQIMYPGPYTVEEAYIPSRQVIGFVLKFSDPRDETFWLLKNS